jgi:hypothetical protein
MKICPVCQRYYEEDYSLCADDHAPLIAAPVVITHPARIAGQRPVLPGAAITSQTRRNRRPLFVALFTILAFTLGGVASLWLFNRARAAAPLSLAPHQTATEATPPPAQATPETGDIVSKGAKTVVHPAAGPEVRQPTHPNDSDKKVSVATSERTQVAQQIAQQTSPIANTPEKRNVSGGRCTLALSKSQLTLHGNGGSAEVAVSLGNPTGPPTITATTGDWANVVVFPGARRGGVSFYRIVSVSQRPGTYGVTFSSPCGTKRVAVIVEK